MSRAMASATDLLASRCIEMAEQAGADHHCVASMVCSAVDVSSPGDLITLTAAPATALRAEGALGSRFPREQPKRNAVISRFTDGHFVETEDRSLPCAGDLLQHTRKGVLRWKRVKIYMNKMSQVKIKLKSKHVGGAFSKKDKCLVYGVSDEISASASIMSMEWESTETYFGLQTAQGFLEFKCRNKMHKQQWVDGIRGLMSQAGAAQCSGHSMELNNRR